MQKRRLDLKNLSLAALLSGVLMLSAMLCFPIGDSRVTLQFFAVLLLSGLLPLKYAALSILCYLAAGALGLPVFAGFAAGPGVLFGPGGGFLLGFLPSSLLFCLLCRKSNRFFALFPSALAALALCYLTGGIWYLLYLKEGASFSALALLLLPYLLPDLLKCTLACLVLSAVKPKLLKNSGSAG
jgi:biotin transport system substrate-specific component